MGWPDIDLPVEVLAAFGADLTANPRTWSWTDLTGRLRGPIRVRAGRSEGASKTSPASATLLLDNEDGALTPDHPMSPFWPHVDMSTPVWLRLRPELLDEPTVADAFDRVAAGGWGSADTGGVWTRTGAGGTVDGADWAVNGAQATHSVPTTAAYRHSTLLDVELADVQATTTVTLPATPTGGPIEAGLMLRVQTVNQYYLCRMEVQPSGAVAARIYGSGLLASATVPGLTYTGQQLRIRAQAVGRTLAMRVWSADAPEPAVWHVEADDASITEPGGVGIYSGVAAGNTNTKPVVVAYDHFEARPYWELLTGYADQWEPQYVPTGDGVTSLVRLTLSGVLRRLEQGASPVRSPLHRAYATADPQPIAWWPLEDGPAVDRAASGLPDGQPVAELGKPPGTQIGSGNYPGTIVWGVRGSGGAASLVSLSLGGRLSATFPASSASSWTFEFVARHDAGSNPNGFATVPVYLRYLDQWEWALRFDPNGAVDLAGGTVTGEVGVLMTAPFSAWDGYLHHIRIDVEQDGADAAHYLWIDGEFLTSAYWFGHTVVVPTSVRLEHAGGGPHEPSIGHLALFAPRAPYYDQVRPSAAQAWLGEPAAARIARLCAEEGVRFRGDGVLAESTAMGPQGTAPLMELIRECEAADGGLLGETDWGLSYRPRTARYNLSPSLAVDMAAYRYSEDTNPSTVLAPRLDDAATRNEWTVSRPEGSSVTVADLGHQQRVGRYDDSVELNVLSDQVLRDHAGWRVHLGTHSTRRYPAQPLDLAANPELVADWLRLRLGDRMTLTGLPAQHPPGPVDLVVEGWSAQLGARQWQVTLPGEPYAPWRVATAGGAQRAPTEGSTLAAPLADGEMTASLAYTVTRWVTDSAHFPLRLRIGGEEVEVSAISGTSSPQTATISARGLNGITRSWPAGTPVQVSDPAIAPL